MKKRSLIENYQSFNLSSKKTISTISSNSPNYQRGRQLISNRKPFFINTNINYSNNSTCETKKHILPPQNNIKIKNNYIKRERISISNSDNLSNESDSCDSNEIKKKIFFEEESFNYPTRSDVGLNSSEEESIEMDPHFKFNLENEIESFLIEMYNKNFPCNDKSSNKIKNYRFKRDKYRYQRKNNIEVNKNELKITFGQLTERYNFFVLQILSKKIKELIRKYKEKLFENEDLSKISDEFKKKKEEMNIINNTTNKLFQEYFSQSENKQLIENKVFSSTASTSSQQSDSFILSQLNQFNLDKNFFQITKDSKNTNLGTAIIRELNNIKTSLKNSSYEIKQIFQYPLNLLKGNFSIECIQLEAFNSILIKDDLISTILFQIKKYLSQKKSKYNIEFIDSLKNDKNYDKEEMTRFDKLLAKKLKIKYEGFNENSKECIIDNNSIESDNICSKKNILSSSFSSIDSPDNINNNIQKNQVINNSKDTIEDEKSKLDELDIDDLVKLIDSDENTVHKKKKKKKNKNKNKNKKNKNNKNLNSEEKNQIKIENSSNKEDDLFTNFDILYDEFKKDIIKNSYENCYQKIKPKLSTNWLIDLYTKGINKNK